MTTLIMKFGGASVATPEHFSAVADLVIRRLQKFEHLVVVVSAMGDTTDELELLAKRVNPNPPRREYDMLVSVGERISGSLLAMALAAKGRQANSYTGSQAGIITCPQHTNATIVDVRPHRIVSAFSRNLIAIVAGFQGVSTEGEITTLGRGGSDTTAVALGIALGADQVEFYKDVPGVFEEDPHKNPQAKPYSILDYEQALAVVARCGQILHPRCLRLAQSHSIPLIVRSFTDPDAEGTRIASSENVRRSQTASYEEMASV